MEQRLKERLTGAAILVALLVLIVPELFRGQAADRSGRAASAEGPPLRSYTIDLGGSHTAPMQLSTAATRAEAPPLPVAASNPAPPPSTATMPLAGTTGTTGSTGAMGSTPTMAAAAPPTPVPSITSTPTHRSATVHPSRASKALHAASASHEATTPSHGASAAHASSRAHAASGSWTVQLGLFSKRANAEHMLHSAAAKGIVASLSKPDARGRYRVRVSGLATRAQALMLAARLRAAGLPAATIGPVAVADTPRPSR